MWWCLAEGHSSMRWPGTHYLIGCPCCSPRQRPHGPPDTCHQALCTSTSCRLCSTLVFLSMCNDITRSLKTEDLKPSRQWLWLLGRINDTWQTWKDTFPWQMSGRKHSGSNKQRLSVSFQVSTLRCSQSEKPPTIISHTLWLVTFN